MFIYEYVTNKSTMWCQDECKSLQEALDHAEAHLHNHESQPMKILNDKKEVIYNCQKIKEYFKNKHDSED